MQNNSIRYAIAIDKHRLKTCMHMCTMLSKHIKLVIFAKSLQSDLLPGWKSANACGAMHAFINRNLPNNYWPSLLFKNADFSQVINFPAGRNNNK